MNAEQVARVLGISSKTVLRHIERGTIAATRKHKQELEIAEDQIEILRQALILEKSRRMPGISQDMSGQMEAIEQRVANLEQRLSELESRHESSPPIEPQKPPVSFAPSHPFIPQTQPQKSIVEPSETMPLVDFAKMSGIPSRTLHNWIEAGKIEVSSRSRLSGGGIEYLISPEEQEKALQRRHKKL